MSTSPTPAELRAELERLVLTDLVGSCSDPHEQLPGVRSPVREWYLVGMLAPMGTIVDPSRNDGDDLQDGDEGGAPGRMHRSSKVVLFLLSVGLTAAVDPSCSSLEVSASWGGTRRLTTPDPTAVAKSSACGSGIPLVARSRCRLVEGDVGPLVPDSGNRRWRSGGGVARRRTVGRSRCSW